jgi:hypothetical protein
VNSKQSAYAPPGADIVAELPPPSLERPRLHNDSGETRRSIAKAVGETSPKPLEYK